MPAKPKRTDQSEAESKPTRFTRFVAYDAFINEIQVIREWATSLEHYLAKQPLPIRITHGESRYGFNISDIVESALMKMARDLETNPLPLDEWNRYYQRYVEIGNETPDGAALAGVGQHAGEVKVWISEKSNDDILTIIRYAQESGVTFSVYHRKDAPRFRLIVALAIMYSAEHLPPLPG